MNDIKIYNPELKLVRPNDQAVEGRSAWVVTPPEELDGAISRLNDYVQHVQRDLQSGQTIGRVVDNETQEVIRQIPDEVALRLAYKLLQYEPLTLFTIKT